MKSGDWMVLSILMALGLILLMLGGAIALGEANLEELPSAETQGRYELYALPPVTQSDFPADLFVSHIMKVDIDWAAVRRHRGLQVQMELPYDASQVFAVYLTDWQHWIPPDMEQTGDNTLSLTLSIWQLWRIGELSDLYLLIIAIV